MRILVLGAGGIGGYFGGRLAAAGTDVSFLVRAERASQLSEGGLTIRSPLGDLRIPVGTLTKADRPFDAIILACKAYDLEAAMEAIAPAVGGSSVVLPLLNGVRQLEVLDARFGKERILGGLCHIGVTVTTSGEVHHLNSLQHMSLGPRTNEQTQPAAELHRALAPGGFKPVLSDEIVQDMWEKFTFLAAYAGVTTLMQAHVGAILSADDGEKIVRDMLTECCAVATESGHTPRSAALEQMVTTLTDRASLGTASMFRDMSRRGPTEHDHIIGDMLTRAEAAGISVPLLRVSFANMQIYATRRSGTSAA